VSFLYIFLLYFRGVPTVCHLLSIFLLYCGGVPIVCHSCRFFYYILEVFRQCVISCRVFYYILEVFRQCVISCQFFYYIVEVFRQCVIPGDFSIILWSRSESVPFLSIFLLYCGGVPTVCHSCRFFYYIVEVFRQCVILFDFSIILWRCSDSVKNRQEWHTVGTPPQYNRQIDKNDTLSEHLHNIIEKSTNCGGVPTVCHSCRFFYYIVEVFRQCVILGDFSIILWSRSDSVPFLSIFLLYCGGVPTVCHSCRLHNIIEKSTRMTHCRNTSTI
jgi:hypothetical protein